MNHTTTTTITQETWGEADGKQVNLYTLANAAGMEVKITNYGGIITACHTPDWHGHSANVLLGFDNLKRYLDGHPYFGALVGRYANRIAKGRFTLEDAACTLAVNNGENHLHGGNKGFSKVVWDAVPNGDRLTLSYLSEDMEEGYPGTLKVTVTYRLTEANELVIEYRATTDRTTHINLTSHGYFNLTGDFSTHVLDHILMLNATQYTPVDGGSIPTGELKAVAGTPFDFTRPEKIGSRISQVGIGYDHNFVLDTADPSAPAAVLYDPASGRRLETYTTEPGIQFYTGNYLDGSLKSPAGIPYGKHAGLCLETQHFPDSPNKPHFPSTVLRPGDTFHSVTRYRFSVVGS